MVNRSIQQKILKIKRRGRYAKFSGSSVKFVKGDVTKAVVYFEETNNGSTITTKGKTVYVGHTSLSVQKMKAGGVNQERMKSYYEHGVRSCRTLGEYFNIIPDPRYAKVWWEIPETNKINLLDDGISRLDMIWHGKVWFFVELDKITRIIKRSRDYGSKQFAMNKLTSNEVTWVEQIPVS